MIAAPARSFYIRLLKNQFLSIIRYSVLACLHDPRCLRYFFEVARLIFSRDAIEPATDDIELLYIAIDRRFQNQGIGGQLIEALIEEARKGEFTRCIVKTLEGDKGAGRFYAGNGFTRLSSACGRDWFQLRLS